MVYREPTQPTPRQRQETPVDPEQRLERLKKDRRDLFLAMENFWDGDKDAAFESLGETGVTIKGQHYDLVDFLGKGEYGAVFLAEHELPAGGTEAVVIKISRPFDRRDQFLSEDGTSEDRAKASRARQQVREFALQHTLGQDGSPFAKLLDGQLIPHPDDTDRKVADRRIAVLVLEKIDGTNLADLIEETGDLSQHPDIVMQVALELTRAVDIMHKAGVVHSDVHTHQIIIDDDFRARLLDFGLSQYIEPPQAKGVKYKKPVEGMVAGSPEFMPESVGDNSRSGNSPARDAYAVGRLLQHMLYGEAFKSGIDMNAKRVRTGNKVLREIDTIATSLVRSTEDPKAINIEQALEKLTALSDSAQEVAA